MAERILMKGNEAIAEAAIRAGCRHYFGYPITPQTEIAAYMAKRMPKIGGTFLQAESEVAAINIIGKDSDAGRDCPKRRRGRQRMRWLDGITDSMDVESG